MKKLALFLVPFLIQLPATAQQVTVFDECKRYIIEEEYIPGYYTNTGEYRSGRVKRHKKRVPCNGGGHQPTYHPPNVAQPYQQPQAKRCGRNQNILGGLLGGGVAALVSKKDAYAWSIPLGVISGVAVSRADC
tara:strand:- start:398 stop:796 length:399 start_codon:yes stop_codon:yes gene_type:complete